MKFELSSFHIVGACILLTTGFVFGVAWSNQQSLPEEVLTVSTDRIETIESNGFTLVAEHLTGSEWGYTITGVLPNKCSRYDVTEIVAESMPEQVTVTLAVSEPEDDSLCAQVLQKVEETGSFIASAEASISFVYTQENSRPTATGLESKNEN